MTASLNEKLSQVEWGEYKLGDLFTIKPTKAYKLRNADLFVENGQTPVVTNSSMNNGVTGYSNLAPTEKGNLITYSDTTTSEGIFYQPSAFIGYSHIQGLYPKRYNENWNEKTLSFVVAAIKRVAKGRFSYGIKFNRAIAAQLNISLPTKNQAIDFEFIESFIAELEAQRIAELEAYLQATGLSTTDLTQDEEEAIYIYNQLCKGNSGVKSKEGQLMSLTEIQLGDLFTIKSSKKKFDANKVTVLEEGSPYVVRLGSNNGVKGYLKEDSQYLNPGNSLSFGQDTATVFYQEKAFFTGDKIKVLEPSFMGFNKNNALFFVCAIKKAFQAHAWGDSFNLKVLKTQSIQVPTIDGEIDLNLLVLLSKSIQKLVIKDVVNYTDQKMKVYKQVIEQK